jgi:hypothetical protein
MDYLRISDADPGAQLTAQEYTERREETAIAVRRDGPGGVFDHVLVERLWSSRNIY